MALGTPVLARPIMETKIVRPAQIPAEWVTIIDAGVAGTSLSGLEQQDAATITDPAAEITRTTTHILKVSKGGTTARFRMKYDDGLTSITDPILKVFGRTQTTDGSTQQWQILLKKSSGAVNDTMTMVTTLASDVSDGTDNWTDVDADDLSFDLDGCDEVLVGVQTALAATGDPTLASLEAKVI